MYEFVYMLWPWTRIILFIIYIMVMPRGHKERSFIILGAIQTARKTYALVLRVHSLIYGEKKKKSIKADGWWKRMVLKKT